MAHLDCGNNFGVLKVTYIAYNAVTLSGTILDFRERRL